MIDATHELRARIADVRTMFLGAVGDVVSRVLRLAVGSEALLP